MAVRKKAVKKPAARKPAAKKAATASKSVDLSREIIMKAVVDPAFRRKMFRKPEDYFGRITKADRAALDRMKKTLPAMDDILTSQAGEILCGGINGCPGLA